MKRTISLFLILVVCAFMTSCTTFYNMIGMTPEETHQYAVVKAKDVIYAYIDKRVDKADLSDVAKAELKIAIKEIVDDAFEKLDKVYREKTQKDMEEAGKCIVDEAIDDGTVVIEVVTTETPEETPATVVEEVPAPVVEEVPTVEVIQEPVVEEVEVPAVAPVETESAPATVE